MTCSRKENSNLRVTHTREEREVPLTLVRSTPQKADLGTHEQEASMSSHRLLLEDQSNATSHTRKPLVPPWALPTAPCCSEWPPTRGPSPASCTWHWATPLSPRLPGSRIPPLPIPSLLPSGTTSNRITPLKSLKSASLGKDYAPRKEWFLAEREVRAAMTTCHACPRAGQSTLHKSTHN